MNQRLAQPHAVPAKIIPRIFGGLGNQLFCYAAARRLALVNNAELIIDNVSGFTYDAEYRRQYQLDHFSIPCRRATAAERLEPLQRPRRYLKRWWNQRLPFAERAYLVQVGLDFNPDLLHFLPRGTVYLEGYWQSEDYFLDVCDILHKDLQIKPPVDTVNKAMAAQIRDCEAVAVHVRFFDDPQTDGTNDFLIEYYTRAIQAMDCLVPSAHYFVFSDKPAAALSRIPLPAERVTVVAHNTGDAHAYADLWLMTQCQHFVIANSTFSWWGAWLASNPAKHVIAPGCEMRLETMSWGFKGLLPTRWIKL